MKKFVSVVLTVILVLILCACGNDEKETKQKDIAVQTEYLEYDYNDLKKNSNLIIKATAQDELSPENSVVESDSEDPEAISDFYALREVKIEKVYGGDEQKKFKSGGTMKIIEDAAISDKFYFHGEGYNALEKGSEYILFLNKDNANKEYSIISANNGKMDLSGFDKISDDLNLEVTVKALAEFESDESDAIKKEIIKSEIKKADDGDDLPDTLSFDFGKIHYKKSDGNILYVSFDNQ